MSAPKSNPALKNNAQYLPSKRNTSLEAQRTVAAVSKVTTELSERILHLRSRGVLRDALLPLVRFFPALSCRLTGLFLQTAAFEMLEFYGDAVLQERVSKFIVQTRRFMNPQLMSTLRYVCHYEP